MLKATGKFPQMRNWKNVFINQQQKGKKKLKQPAVETEKHNEKGVYKIAKALKDRAMEQSSAGGQCTVSPRTRTAAAANGELKRDTNFRMQRFPQELDRRPFSCGSF